MSEWTRVGSLVFALTMALGAVAAATFALTWIVRRLALRTQLLDIPNARSSHSVPTPRGGGIAIATVTLASMAILYLQGNETADVLPAFMLAGFIVAAIGFVDDSHHVSTWIRLAVHLGSAAIILAAIGRIPPLRIFTLELDPGPPAAQAIAACFIAWLLNLYNFMDGIDGIAGVEAVTVAGGAAVLLALNGATGFALIAGILAAASLGFLVWNWPPAKIFMGDAGSGFLGFSFGALAVATAAASRLSLWVWLILLGVFMVDAAVTIVRRTLRGEAFYVAHRSHAYQFASRRWGAHRPVTVAVGLINLLWLLPLAALAASGVLDGFVATLVAYAPLTFVAFHFKAGARELQGG